MFPWWNLQSPNISSNIGQYLASLICFLVLVLKPTPLPLWQMSAVLPECHLNSATVGFTLSNLCVWQIAPSCLWFSLATFQWEAFFCEETILEKSWVQVRVGVIPAEQWWESLSVQWRLHNKSLYKGRRENGLFWKCVALKSNCF